MQDDLENKFNKISIIRRLVLAPAYYDEESKTSIIEVEEIVEELNAYLKEKNSYLVLYPANLIRDNYDSVKDFLNKRIGTINGSKYVLLNSEESNTVDELLELVFELNLVEVTPIIVGPEKNEEIKNDYKKIEKLINKGCLFQLDVESLNGAYGKSVQKTCKKLIKKNIYDFIGFEEDIKSELIDKEIEKMGKKGLYIFKTDELIIRKSIEKKKKKKKIGSWIK